MQMPKMSLACWLGLLCGLATPLSAGINEWTSIGPSLGTVCTLVAMPAHPFIVYAGVEGGGVYRSLDSGRTWQWRSPEELGDASLCLLGVDASDADTVYGSNNGRLRKSTDGGVHWTLVNIHPEDTTIVALAVHPTHAGRLYVSGWTGVWRSDNGGLTWSLLPGSPPVAFALTLVPGQTDTLYAGTAAAGVFRSTDGGLTWAAVNRGLDPRDGVADIVFDPRRPQTLYLSTGQGPPFKSTDGGNRWRRIDRGFNTSAGRLSVDPDRPSTIYATTDAGIYRSTDAGASWRQASANLPIFAARDVLAIPDMVLVGLFGHSVFRSEDDAASWSSTRGITAGQIRGFAVDPLTPATYYAADLWAGIYKTPDRGARWNRLGFPSLRLPLAGVLALDPVTPTTVYAAWAEGIAKSLDAGRTWSSPASLPCVEPTWIEIDPRQPSTLYTGGLHTSRCGVSTGACGLWKSTNAGSSWSCLDSALPFPFTNVFAMDPVDTRTLYTTLTNVLYRSTDGGASWSEVFEGPFFWDLEIDPWSPSTLYAALQGEGVARSTDRGETWETLGGDFEGRTVIDVEIDPTQPATLYAAAVAPAGASSRVYKSTDSGETWTPLGQELRFFDVSKLVLDPVNPSVLYARTNDHSVLQIAQQVPGECRTDENTLCLGGRIAARVTWKDFAGRSGPARTRPLTGDSGAFWFFDDDNIELAVKALDGSFENGFFWIFYGALTNVEYTLVVTDTGTGEVKGYHNPAGRFFSQADPRAFRALGHLPGGGTAPPPPATGCGAGEALCLGEGGRFHVTVNWQDFTGHRGIGHPVALTADTGTFWFFGESNVELILKVLDGRGDNGHFWVFYGALSDVSYTITVTDTVTGQRKTYVNPPGHMASVGDTEAF
ncbi:MAG TPA: hypothetical protein VMW27_28270 [Thermoanaerobaculia bacterium]|nr:hypothetical protein [Thermoanaerobaculia bacterium]